MSGGVFWLSGVRRALSGVDISLSGGLDWLSGREVVEIACLKRSGAWVHLIIRRMNKGNIGPPVSVEVTFRDKRRLDRKIKAEFLTCSKGSISVPNEDP